MPVGVAPPAFTVDFAASSAYPSLDRSNYVVSSLLLAAAHVPKLGSAAASVAVKTAKLSLHLSPRQLEARATTAVSGVVLTHSEHATLHTQASVIADLAESA